MRWFTRNNPYASWGVPPPVPDITARCVPGRNSHKSHVIGFPSADLIFTFLYSCSLCGERSAVAVICLMIDLRLVDSACCFFVSSLLAEIYLARILPQKSFIGVMVLSFERRDFPPAGRINALCICFAFTEAKYRYNTNYFFSLFVEWSPEIEISLLAYAVRLFDQDWRDSLLLVQAAPRGVQPSCFFPLPHADVPVLTVIH